MGKKKQGEHYSIMPEFRFGMDRMFFGPGVELVFAPEAEDYLADLGLVGALDEAYNAGKAEVEAEKKLLQRVDRFLNDFQAGQPKRMRAFLEDLVACTRLTPGIVNHGEVLRLIGKHLPEFAAVGAHPGAQSPSEGTHGAAPATT